MTARVRPDGGTARVSTLTCTWSTSPITTASVPGRALRPSSLVGSGPWSSWYSTSDQSDHAPPSCVRTCTPIWSSPSWTPCAQVTPIDPNPFTCCGVLTTSVPLATRRVCALRAPGASRAPAGAVSANSRTTGSTASVGTWVGTWFAAT